MWVDEIKYPANEEYPDRTAHLNTTSRFQSTGFKNRLKQDE